MFKDLKTFALLMTNLQSRKLSFTSEAGPMHIGFYEGITPPFLGGFHQEFKLYTCVQRRCFRLYKTGRA